MREYGVGGTSAGPSGRGGRAPSGGASVTHVIEGERFVVSVVDLSVGDQITTSRNTELYDMSDDAEEAEEEK